MDKKQVDQLEDLQITQLMGMYAEEEGRRLMAENERLQNDPDFVVPEHFHDACLAAIQKAEEQERKKRLPSRAIKHLKHVAVLAVVLLGISGAMFVSVDAFRTRIMNTFVEYGDKSARIEITDTEIASFSKEAFCSVSWLPDGYEVETVQKKSDNFQKICCLNETGEIVALYCMTGFAGFIDLDTEDADVVREVKINGNDGLLVVKDEIQLSWVIPQIDLVCNLCCPTTVGIDDAIKIAESVK